MQRSAVRSAIVRRHPQEQRVFILLGDLDDDVEVAAIVEDAGVDQLELRIVTAAAPVLFDQPPVRKLPLRILVKHPLVRVTGKGIEIEVALFDVFSMIALTGYDAEVALLQDRLPRAPE